MTRVKLDRIDRHILQILQADGRVTNVKLAKTVGISAPPCLRRVRALEAAGYIRGYHADLNTESLGFGVSVFAQVGLESQAEQDLAAFEKLVASWPMVRECFMLAGEVDFLLKVVGHRLGCVSNVPHDRTDGRTQRCPSEKRPCHPALKVRTRGSNRYRGLRRVLE